jgi:intracellular multiplication protein IcmK
MKRALLLLLTLTITHAAWAEDAAATVTPSPITPSASDLPVSVPFAPSAATPAPAASPVVTPAAPGVATSIPPAPAAPPGGVGMPAALGQAAPAAAAGPPPAQLVDPALFGTLLDPSYQTMTGQLFPMTDDQIRAFRDLYENTKRITAEPARTPPRPLVSSQTISLAPGTVPPVIRLANGYVSSIVFVDETGAPWPVAAYSVGNPQAFNIQWDSESNLLMIQGIGAYVTGNMAVTLVKLPTPIMFTIVSEQNVVDYRVDFRVQGRGPQASGAIINASLPQNNSQLLMNLLDGVPPQDAAPLEVVGGNAQAWLRGSAMYLRTPLTVLSPSWTATMTSPDGTKVYQLNPTPMVLVSDRGQTVVLKVKGL